MKNVLRVAVEDPVMRSYPVVIFAPRAVTKLTKITSVQHAKDRVRKLSVIKAINVPKDVGRIAESVVQLLRR